MVRRRKLFQVLPALLLTLIAVAAVPAAENVLALVPEDAWGFVVVTDVGATIEKIEKLSERIGAPVPSPLLMFKTTAGIDLDLNEEGDALLVMMPPAGELENPSLVTVMPVADYEAFVGRFSGNSAEGNTVLEIGGENVLVAEKGDYAVMTGVESKAALEAFLARDVKLAAVIASLDEWIASNQTAAAVLPGGVRAGMDQALRGLEQGRAVFQNMAANVQDQQAQQMKQVLQMMGVAEQFCEGVKDEVSVFAIGARIDANENIFIASRTQATSGGKLAEWTDSVEKQEVHLLAGLPAGPFVLAGGAAVSEQAMEVLTRWSIQMMKANPQMYGAELSEEDVDKLAKASLAAMKGVRTMSMSMAPGEGNEPLYDTMTVALTVENPAAYLANYKQAVLASSGLMKGPDGEPLMEMEAIDVEVAGVAALKVTLDMSGMFEALERSPGVPQIKAFTEMMIGEGGKTQVFVVPVGEKTVVMKYGSEEKVVRAVRNMQSGGADLSQDAQVGHTADLLPAGAQGLLYVSPSGVVAMVDRFVNMIAQAMGQQAPPLEIPMFPASPPIGCTLKVVPGRLETEEVVPGETLKALGDYVRQF